MAYKRGIRLATDWDEVPIVMDLPYAARILGCTRETVKRYCIKRKIPAFKLGGEWRIEKTALRSHIEANNVMNPHPS